MLASQVMEGIIHPLRIAQGYSLKDGLDLAETFCLLGYLSYAQLNEGVATGPECLARATGGDKQL